MSLRQKFKSAIRRGTGEAHLLLKANPRVDFSREIIDAALANYAYDAQCEGSRDVYAAELIALSGRRDEILPVLCDALRNDEREDWSTQHLLDVLAIFAKEGDARAKAAIYESFDKYAERGAFFGDDAIAEIDGLRGLLHVAGRKGKYLSENADERENSFFVDHFQYENPQLDVYVELRKASANDRYVEKYLAAIEANKFEYERPGPAPVYDYRYVKERIDNDKNRYLGIGPRAVEKVPKRDVKKLTADFLNETKRIRRIKYLKFFGAVKFPLGHRPLLELAQSARDGRDRLKYLAVEALSFFKSYEVRDYALANLRAFGPPHNYATLLVRNYRKGDAEILRSVIEGARNREIVHSLARSVVEIYRANRTKECRAPLEALYDRLTCGLHRSDIVEILHENEVLPDRIKREIEFDSYEPTRELYKEFYA